MARWAVTSEPRSPGRSGGWPGGGLKSPALALVMASPHVRAPCVKCATTSPTTHPAHALGLPHASGPRCAKKSRSWDASALINSITSVITVFLSCHGSSFHTDHERYDTTFFRQCFSSAAYLTVAKMSALYFRSEDET